MTDTASRVTPPGWSELQYDHRDPKVVYAPHDLWRRLRRQCPVIHSDRYGGFWFVSRYDDVRTVLRDTDTFTTTLGVNIPRQNMTLLPGEVDPPRHRAYRDILNPPLGPKVVARYEPEFRALAREWLARLEGKDRFDACTEYCEPYAKRVALLVIGYDVADLDPLDEWTTILASGVRDDETGLRASQAFFAHLAGTLERRSGEPPRDDVISAIVHGSVDGRR